MITTYKCPICFSLLACRKRSDVELGDDKLKHIGHLEFDRKKWIEMEVVLLYDPFQFEDTGGNDSECSFDATNNEHDR